MSDNQFEENEKEKLEKEIEELKKQKEIKDLQKQKEELEREILKKVQKILTFMRKKLKINMYQIR